MLPLELQLHDQAPDDSPITIEVHTGDQPLVVQTTDGTVRVRPGTASTPDATVSGTPLDVLGVLTGTLDLDTARTRGLEFDGDPETLRRIQPIGAP